MTPVSSTSSRTSFFARVEGLGKNLARRRSMVLALVAAATLALRLSLLWVEPVPEPTAHDEFSYLLAGDTFAHGRLTNPAHPTWVFLDTIHVNQQPTYMSKYPPAQGMGLALGECLGHPWIGVLLSVASMCAAVTWMLQGWFSPEWALLGGLLIALRFGAFNYWIDSYWGGAMAAIGGALVMGTLPRMMRRRRAIYACILGIGLAILAISRPVEGLIFSLPVAATFGWWLFDPRVSLRTRLWSGLGPLAVILIGAVGWLGYYNWRGTGNPLLFPYVAYQRAHFASPPLLVQKLPPPHHFLNPQFTDYSDEQRAEYTEHRAHFIRSGLLRTGTVLVFICGPLLAAPLLTLPWLLRDRIMRLLWAQLAVSLVGLMVVSAFFIHYAAPLTATVWALAMQGMRHLRRLRVGSHAIGVIFTRAIVLTCIALVPAHVVKTWHDERHGINWTNTPMLQRVRIARELESQPGDHLVIVHYSPRHDVHSEWVYNSADIDHSKIVWVREIPGVDLTPLLGYFRGRKVWIIEPDSPNIELQPYPNTVSP